MVASQRFFKIFTPKNWWKMNPFWLAHTLADGWFNHQPSDLVTCSPTNSSSLWALGFRWNSWRGICVRERSTFWNKRSKPWRWKMDGSCWSWGKPPEHGIVFWICWVPLEIISTKGKLFFCKIFFLRVSPRFRMISIHDIKDEKKR